MGGAIPLLRGLSALEWVILLALSVSALCLISLAALMIVRAARWHWRRFQRHRKRRTLRTERE